VRDAGFGVRRCAAAFFSLSCVRRFATLFFCATTRSKAKGAGLESRPGRVAKKRRMQNRKRKRRQSAHSTTKHPAQESRRGYCMNRCGWHAIARSAAFFTGPGTARADNEDSAVWLGRARLLEVLRGRQAFDWVPDSASAAPHDATVSHAPARPGVGARRKPYPPQRPGAPTVRPLPVVSGYTLLRVGARRHGRGCTGSPDQGPIGSSPSR